MQTTPKIRTAVQETENLIDVIQKVTADGVYCCNDRAIVNAQIKITYGAVMEADDAQALGISMMRNGPTSQRTMRLARQYEQDHGDAA